MSDELDIKLLEILPKLKLEELEEMDITEKLMLIKEYSLTDEERKKESEEAILLEEILKVEEDRNLGKHGYSVQEADKI